MANTFIAAQSAGGLNGATTASIDTTDATLIVVVCGFYGSGTPTISDSVGGNNNGTPTALTKIGPADDTAVRIYYWLNPTNTGAGHTFTVSATGVAPCIAVAAFKGDAGTSSYDNAEVGGTASGVAASPFGNSTLTPGGDNRILISGVCLASSISSFTAANSLQLAAHQNFVGGTSYGIGLLYEFQTTATARSNTYGTATWTTGANVAYAGAAFLAAAPAVSDLVSGSPSLSSVTSTTINVSVGAASGGTPSYTYQWYRSTTSNFTPGAGNLLSGATSTTLADSTGLSADTPYYYVCRVTDSGAQTADSKQIAGALRASTLILGFIGDSITDGYGLSAGQEPHAYAASYLTKLFKFRTVTVSDQSVNASKTSEWASGQANLTTAKSAFSSAGVTHVHIMLGANDAAASNLVSAATYGSNLSSCVNDLVGAGYKVILSYPTYIPAGANNNVTTAASVALTQSYQAQIDALVNHSTILRGDTLAFNYFADNLSEYQSDQTHPTATGSASLGLMWARAIDRALYKRSGGAARTVTITLTTDGSTPAANLTGLRWSFWDEVTPDLMACPADSGTAETTDGSGVLTITVNTKLAASGVGWLVVTNSDGTTSQSPAHKAFSGPVTVS
jgi:lysophospholipase L1-like esterase